MRVAPVLSLVLAAGAVLLLVTAISASSARTAGAEVALAFILSTGALMVRRRLRHDTSRRTETVGGPSGA